MARAVLVLDFDGTVCLGDDPVRFYAEEVADRLPEAQRAGLLDALEEFLAGNRELPGCEDGYHAVVALSGELLDAEQRRDAYRASRARLEAGEGQTQPPEGLTPFLENLRSRDVAVVLVTNAPLLGAGTWLAAHGLADHLDAVIPDAGKPIGMPAVLSGILAEYGVPPAHLASVGDVWRNDVEPALALGAAGMFIDRFGSGRGPSTHTAESFTELYGPIEQWASAALGAMETESSPN